MRFLSIRIVSSNEEPEVKLNNIVDSALQPQNDHVLLPSRASRPLTTSSLGVCFQGWWTEGRIKIPGGSGAAPWTKNGPLSFDWSGWAEDACVPGGQAESANHSKEVIHQMVIDKSPEYKYNLLNIERVGFVRTPLWLGQNQFWTLYWKSRCRYLMRAAAGKSYMRRRYVYIILSGNNDCRIAHIPSQVISWISLKHMVVDMGTQNDRIWLHLACSSPNHTRWSRCPWRLQGWGCERKCQATPILSVQIHEVWAVSADYSILPPAQYHVIVAMLSEWKWICIGSFFEIIKLW